MKKKDTFLSLYENWIKEEELPYTGLCTSLTEALSNSTAFELVNPTRDEMDDNWSEGGGWAFWGNENRDKYSQFNFTPLRQTIMLICAALNGEFDKPKKRKK